MTKMKFVTTGEQYSSVHQAMTALMDELEQHEYHGNKFKKLLQTIATDGRLYVKLFSLPHY